MTEPRAPSPDRYRIRPLGAAQPAAAPTAGPVKAMTSKADPAKS